MGKPEAKRPLGQPSRIHEGNIKPALKKCCGIAWAGFIWPRRGTSGKLL